MKDYGHRVALVSCIEHSTPPLACLLIYAPIYNDGEYGKRSFHEYVVDRLSGLEHRYDRVPTRMHYT
ncbi:MAG: hypothetical protein ACREML_05060, partial [Vulcanimicrobiaceae bacterium]